MLHLPIIRCDPRVCGPDSKSILARITIGISLLYNGIPKYVVAVVLISCLYSTSSMSHDDNTIHAADGVDKSAETPSHLDLIPLQSIGTYENAWIPIRSECSMLDLLAKRDLTYGDLEIVGQFTIGINSTEPHVCSQHPELSSDDFTRHISRDIRNRRSAVLSSTEADVVASLARFYHPHLCKSVDNNGNVVWPNEVSGVLDSLLKECHDSFIKSIRNGCTYSLSEGLAGASAIGFVTKFTKYIPGALKAIVVAIGAAAVAGNYASLKEKCSSLLKELPVFE